LENDLLQLDKHKAELTNGDDADPASSSADLLADLDLGKKHNVRLSIKLRGYVKLNVS
jgi:hypothetical protein